MGRKRILKINSFMVSNYFNISGTSKKKSSIKTALFLYWKSGPRKTLKEHSMRNEIRIYGYIDKGYTGSGVMVECSIRNGFPGFDITCLSLTDDTIAKCPKTIWKYAKQLRESNIHRNPLYQTRLRN